MCTSSQANGRQRLGINSGVDLAHSGGLACSHEGGAGDDSGGHDDKVVVASQRLCRATGSCAGSLGLAQMTGTSVVVEWHTRSN